MPAPPRGSDLAPERPARILVAGADPTVAQTIAWVLREHGYDVLAARDADGLFTRLAEADPDLLLLDALVDAAALPMLARIKREPRWRDLPVLVVGEQPVEDVAADTLGLGAADFVRKPFRVRELLARVEAQLRVRRMLRDAREALRSAEHELLRVREEAEARRRIVDIVHELSAELAPAEIYEVLVRRVARALQLTHCSVVLARAGDARGVLAASIESPALRGREIELARYPELGRALAQDRPVLVGDIRSDPLYDDLRPRWEAEGTVVPVRSVAALPFAIDEQQAGVLFLRRGLTHPPLDAAEVSFADAVVRAAAAAIQRAHLLENARADNARLEALAQTDPLTELLNRRALEERLAAELDRAERHALTLTVLLLDIDYFKDVNDTYGHLVGDEVLRAVARTLAAEARSSDVVARYGGEEFVILLPETDVAGGVIFADRVREQVAGLRFTSPAGTEFRLTVSIGLASTPGGETRDPAVLFDAADRALYRAKAAGRNRVEVC